VENSYLKTVKKKKFSYTRYKPKEEESSDEDS